MSRWIDDIIKVVEDHSYISATHKRVLITRIEKMPTREELEEASMVHGESQPGFLGAEAFGHTANDEQTRTQSSEALTHQDRARRLVFEYVKNRLEKTDTHVTFAEDEVYVVWFTFVLGSWKALVSTTLPDGMYYEVTYNGAKGETYLDAYKKFENVCYADNEEN